MTLLHSSLGGKVIVPRIRSDLIQDDCGDDHDISAALLAGDHKKLDKQFHVDTVVTTSLRVRRGLVF